MSCSTSRERRRPERRLAAALTSAALAFAAAATAGEPAAPWRFWTDPLSLAVHRDDYAVVQRSSFSPDPCDYDPAGHIVPGALDCRYDHLYRPAGRNRFLRMDTDELVLLDERGPGAIVRAWMTTGDGFSADFPADLRLRVRLDGNPIPAVDLPVPQWFDGSTWPFVPPLVGDRVSAAGAGFSYVPIVYRTGAVVTLVGPEASIDANRIWYQFNVQRHARPTTMTSGVPNDIAQWIDFAQTPPGDYPWPAALTWQTESTVIGEGTTQLLFEHTGPDTMLAMRIRPSDSTHGASLIVQMDIDGDRRVDLPLDALFGFDNADEVAQRSLLHGVDDDGYAYLFLPAPFHTSMRLALRQAEGAGDAQVDYAIALSGMPPPAGALSLAARQHNTCIAGGRDDEDLALLDVTGRGRWMSLATRQHNLAFNNANYLEGDERVYVDGSPHPAWHGTGNEDFYNGGFYFDRDGVYGYPHAYPFAGAPWHGFKGLSPVSSHMYRSMLADAVPFSSRLRVRLERGAYGDQPMCSAGVSWLYLEPERALAPIATLDLGDPASVAAAQFEMPAGAICGHSPFAYADEPPTTVAGTVCRRQGGESTFRFTLAQPANRLWLRRRFDGIDGGQAARVDVGDIPVARFPYAMITPDRRWQDVDVPLNLPAQPAGAVLDFRIVPDDVVAPFTESAYVLIATASDVLFANNFED